MKNQVSHVDAWGTCLRVCWQRQERNLEILLK